MIALVAGWLACVPCGATVLIDTQGFESPAFEVGALAGQEGWLDFGDAGAAIQDTAAFDGSQSLLIERQAGEVNFWAHPAPLGVDLQRVSVAWDMQVAPTGAPAGLGPYFGVSMFAEDPSILRVASLGVDATTGDVLVQGLDGALLDTGADVALGQWAHFRFDVDFTIDRYEAFVDGERVASARLIDAVYADIASFADVDIFALPAGRDSASMAMAGSAVLDNLLVFESLPGDYNDDGLVDAVDYTVWRDNLGAAEAGGALSLNGTGGIVDNEDYELWKRHFGNSSATTATIAASMVPEPGSLLLLVLAVCHWLCQAASFMARRLPWRESIADALGPRARREPR